MTEKQTAAELRETAHEKQQALARVEARIAAIRPAGNVNPPGREREAALARGDVEAVREMDAEHESLRVEAESLRVQAKRAREARKDAEAREAAEAMPETHKRLRAKLDAVKAAQAALADAWQEADAEFKAAAQGRAAARVAGYRAEPAPADLVALALSAQDGPTAGRHRIATAMPGTIAAELGVEIEKVAA